jgi:uncharacterized protein
MRLTDQEVKAIITAIDTFVMDQMAELYLYGSRIDDNLKGGDIDLLLITSAASKQKLQPIKYKILAAITNKIGDQKIDLTITTKEEINQSEFLQNITQKVLLKSWG